MRSHNEDIAGTSRSPLRVFVLVLLIVFSVEGAIMLGLASLPGSWRGWISDVLLDASLLTLLLAPALWLLTVRPLRVLFEARGQLLRRLFDSQEEERIRVARDLHDGVGQHLTALMVGLRTIEQSADLATAQQRARELREIGTRGHEDVRTLVRGLHPATLKELGLAAALEQLCIDFQRTHGVETTLRCEPAPLAHLDAAIETALYRIAQEALNNVARHAEAGHVDVRLTQVDGWTSLTICDDGLGFAIDARTAMIGGFGLGSMRERAELLGGTLSVVSRPNAGVKLEARVPAELHG
jgi:signal transduction histidine kinase